MIDKRERPTTIDSALGVSQMPSGEVATEYSPIELLALDEPKYELLSKEQSEMFPRIVYDFFQDKNHNSKEWARFLGYFNINIGVYDAIENPTGMLSGEIRENRINYEDDINLNVAVKAGFLMFCGVKTNLVSSFFGASTTKKSSRGNNARFSKVFFERLDTIRKVRAEYPLRRPKEFAKINKALKTIKKNLGLDPLEIFTDGHIPLLHTSSMYKTLEEILILISMASGGQWTKAALSKRLGFHQVSLSDYFSGGNDLLSKKARDSLDSKI